MLFLNPALLLFSLLAVPVLLLYMLKLRRREMPISSILLWEALLRDRQANAPWQRLKRNLLLFLQLLILAGLVLALARPAWPVPAVTASSTIVLIDASASMNTADVQPNRFQAALTSARQLVDELRPGARMTLILAGRQPQVIASQQSDRGELRRALAGLAQRSLPEQGQANWEAAFAVAAGAAATASTGEDSQADIVILSDGNLPGDLPPLPGEIRYVPVGRSGENLAISALALREGQQGTELFARVTNYGEADRRPVLSFYQDGDLFRSEAVPVTAGASTSLVIGGLSGSSMDSGPVIFEARLSAPGDTPGPLDDLRLDDTAFAIYQPARSQSALLFPSRLEPEPRYNLFLQQALLAVLGEGRSFQARPNQSGSLTIPEEPFNLYLFDGLIPETLPAGNLLLVNPPSNPLFSVSEVFSVTEAVTVADHPLVRFVDWSGVHVREARRVVPPDWAVPLVQAEAGPLVFAGEHEGRRIAVFTFDLQDSDLPLQVSYPILMANLIQYLAPGRGFEAPSTLDPGDSLTIQGQLMADGRPPSQIAVVSPSGEVRSFTPGENGILYAETGELGVYTINYLSEGSQDVEYFAVNLFAESESRIRPAARIQIGQAVVAPAGEGETGLYELWPWLAALSLAVLIAEWWVYHGRQRLTIPGSFLPRPARRS